MLINQWINIIIIVEEFCLLFISFLINSNIIFLHNNTAHSYHPSYTHTLLQIH